MFLELYYSYLAELSMLTQFSVNKTGSDCGFAGVTEVVANSNRIYFYAIHGTVKKLHYSQERI